LDLQSARSVDAKKNSAKAVLLSNLRFSTLDWTSANAVVALYLILGSLARVAAQSLLRT